MLSDEYEALRDARFLWRIYKIIEEQIEGDIRLDKEYTVKIPGDIIIHLKAKAKSKFRKGERVSRILASDV